MTRATVHRVAPSAAAAWLSGARPPGPGFARVHRPLWRRVLRVLAVAGAAVVGAFAAAGWVLTMLGEGSIW